jgi:DNA-binding CsgD family transcriptional regulator
VIKIRALAAAGHHTQKMIADLYMISRSTVSSIINRQTWSHL